MAPEPLRGTLRGPRSLPGTGEGRARAGGMAAGLAIKVVVGLAAASLVAVLLEHYGLAGSPSPLPQPRVPRRPHPAPGLGATNIFWGLQVTQREPGGVGVGLKLAPLGETRAASAGTRPVHV